MYICIGSFRKMTPGLIWMRCDPGSTRTADVSAGLKESMRQADLNNWSLDAAQMADLCSSINQFFTATGVIPPQGSGHPQPQVQHQAPPGAPQHGAMHAKPGQHGQHNQHINAGRSGPSREKNSWYFCLCSWTKAGSVRLSNVTVMYAHDPVCVCVRQSRYANLTATYWFLCFLPQGTCTWIPDRTSLWWAHQDTHTCPLWATRPPPWQVTLPQRAAAIFSMLVMLQRHAIGLNEGIACDESASVSRPPQSAEPAAAQTPAGTLPGETHADGRRHPGRLWLGLHRLSRGFEAGGWTALFHLRDKDKTDDNPTEKKKKTTPFFPPSNGNDGDSKDNQLTKDKRGAERIGPCPGSKRAPEARQNVSVLTGLKVAQWFFICEFVSDVCVSRLHCFSCTSDWIGRKTEAAQVQQQVFFALLRHELSVGVMDERSSTCWSEQVSLNVDLESEGNYFLHFCVNVARKQNPRPKG